MEEALAVLDGVSRLLKLNERVDLVLEDLNSLHKWRTHG